MENMTIQEIIVSIELEERCLECGGDGKEYSREGLTRCGACSGSGFAPTAFGEKLIQLMRHNIQSLLQDVSHD
jgi:DnaJ-class molecular chaperone